MGRILITDDEEMDRVFLNAVLGDAGHELFFAREGQSALAAYREHEIDVVVTDLVMPHLNGLDLIRELREEDHDACIVAVSGAGADKLERAKEAGALLTLRKPLDPAALVEAVKRAERERANLSDPWI